MKQLLILVTGMFLLGCGEPQIKFTSHVIPQSGIQSDLGFSIKYEYTHTKPAAKLFLKYNSTNIIDLEKEISITDDGQYHIRLPSLPAGEYRLLLSVPYSSHVAGINIGQKQKTAIYDFSVHGALPAKCFRFDHARNKLQGWSVRGVYLGDRDKPVSSANCPGLFYVNHSWPYSLNETGKGGSLFVPVASNCFPKQGQQFARDTHWTFTLLSPNLRYKKDWQQINSITFRMATKSIPILVSPEIHYQVGKNKSSTYFHKKLVPQYTLNGGQWKEFVHQIELPKRAIITRVAIHVLGVPEKTVGDGVDSIFLDGICPGK